MTDAIDAAYIIGTIFFFFPFLVWFIRNYKRYAKGGEAPGLNTFFHFSLHLIITGLLFFCVAMLGDVGLLKF